jgi:DUF4097 and DUF4098 domain-containing protein YvlB
MTEFPTSGPISADVAIQVGSIHLIAGDRQETTVVVNPADRAKGVDVEWAKNTAVEMVGGKRLVVKGPKPGGFVNTVLGRYGSIEVTIELPAGSTVDVSNGYGDIRIDGRVADAKAKSGAGEVHIDESAAADLSSGAGAMSIGIARGETRMTTAGDMRIGRIEGNAVIKNMNGKTWIDEATGHLRVKSANGDIQVSKAHSAVVAKTANGNIDIGEVSEGTVSMETGAGALHVGVADGTAAWVDARTSFGRVHNTLQASERPGATDRAVEITARTAFGDITVQRAARTQ